MQVLDEAEKLQSADVVHASEIKAQVYALSGDLESALYWIKNAERNGSVAAPVVRAIVYSNLGYMDDAARELSAFVQRGGAWKINFQVALSMGQPRTFVLLSEQLIKAGGKVSEPRLLDEIKHVVDAMNASGATDDELTGMTAAAGAVLRGRGLSFLGERPDYWVNGDGEVVVRYRVSVGPRDAAEMTWELAERLAERPSLPAGLIVSFEGGSSHLVAA